jgi:hypothetical protein
MSKQYWIAWLASVLLSFIAGFLVNLRFKSLGFTLFGDNGVFRGKRNEGSFTRTGSAVLIALALAVWTVGVYMPDVKDYATTMIGNLIELAKWVFGIGKGTEELKDLPIGKKKEEVTP